MLQVPQRRTASRAEVIAEGTDDTTVYVVESGDHLLYISAVEYVRLGTQRKPLVFFTGGYRQVQAHTPVINWANEADCS